MGQYYQVVNLDKKEFLHPHTFGDGLKLMEFGNSSNGTLLALTLLLASGNGRGGGDFTHNNLQDHPLIGSWAGDRIVIAGDYDDPGKWIDKPEAHDPNANLYHIADDDFKDISEDVLVLLVAGREIDPDAEVFIRRNADDRGHLILKAAALVREYQQ